MCPLCTDGKHFSTPSLPALAARAAFSIPGAARLKPRLSGAPSDSICGAAGVQSQQSSGSFTSQQAVAGCSHSQELTTFIFPPDFSSDHKASPSFSLCANLLPLLRKLSGQKVPRTTFTTASYCSPGKRYFTTGFCCRKATTTQAFLIALLSTCDTKETTKQIVSHKEETQKA